MANTFGKMFQRPDEILDSVPTPEAFTKLVDLIVERYDLTYFEALQEICDAHDREPESIKPLLTSKLKLRLMEEASDRKLLKDNTFKQDRLG